MKKLAATICMVGTAFALSACETGSTHHSGASFAESRTAGEAHGMTKPAPVAKTTYVRPEKVFQAAQTK